MASPDPAHAHNAGESRVRLPRAQREQQVLDIAHRQFAARGYGAVTMEDVAAEAGVTKPLLYAYFGNKERLYLACMSRAGDALLATVGEAVAGAGSPAEALRRGLHAFFAFVDSDRDAWRVLFDETLPAGGEIARAVGEYRERLLALVAQANLERLPAARRADHATDIEAISVALLGAAEALARWWLRTGAIPAADAADLLIATAEPGLQEMAAGRRREPTPLRPVADAARGGAAEDPAPASGAAGRPADRPASKAGTRCRAAGPADSQGDR